MIGGMRMAVCVLAASCGRIGFGFEPSALDASDAPADAAPCGPIAEMSDNFDAGTIAAKWAMQLSPGLTITETGGDLEMTLVTASGNNYANLYSSIPYDLGTCTAAITIVEVPRVTAGSDAAFCLTVAAVMPQQLCFDISNGMLSSHFKNGIVTTYISQPFDAVNQAHLRLHQVSPNVIWETSSDGITWNAFDARPPPLDLTQIRVELFAGTALAITNPGIARFDNLIVQ
jgi:hypothetical protein